MKSRLKLIVGTVVGLALVFVALAYVQKQKQRGEEQAKAEAHKELLERPNRPSLGPQNAPVTVVEFLDPECEACAAFYPAVKAVIREFPGKVRLVVRYMPLHKNSTYAATLLEILRARGKFWEGLETFLQRQPEWARHEAPKPELLPGYVQQLGVGKEELENALKDFMYEGYVKQDEQDARALGVTGTPTFFVNGERVSRLSYASLKEMIETKLR